MTATRFGIAAVLALLTLMAGALWPVVPGLSGLTRLAGTGSPTPGRTAADDFITGVLTTGERSPMGVDPSGMTAEQALKKAEQAIFNADGKASANLAERTFWLRKSITLMLAEPQSRWALTQLGAHYTAATSDRERQDYGSAKALWEIASAAGDPIAACFLAELYRLGLGVQRDSQRAAEWTARAGRSGCELERDHRAPPGGRAP